MIIHLSTQQQLFNPPLTNGRIHHREGPLQLLSLHIHRPVPAHLLQDLLHVRLLLAPQLLHQLLHEVRGAAVCTLNKNNDRPFIIKINVKYNEIKGLYFQKLS